jgi:drug/metabolite transporter (DMT)-like permease
LTSSQGWERLAPVLFVVLWSTGFIGAKLGLPYAEPLTFLGLRLAIVALLLGTIGLALRAPWPADHKALAHIVIAGLLVHGGYLGGVFSAIHRGLSAGLVALIVGLQPVLTAVAAGFWFGERVTRRQWAGLGLGLAGVGLVVAGKIDLSGLSAAGLGLALIALLSITAGTLYQKRYCGTMDFRTGGAIQYAAAGLVFGLLASVSETMQVVWSGAFVFALAWLCLVLSVGAVSLLYFLIKRGAAAQVSSLFYLTPPVTALMAWWCFAEPLTPLVLAGIAVAALGVALVTHKGAQATVVD